MARWQATGAVSSCGHRSVSLDLDMRVSESKVQAHSVAVIAVQAPGNGIVMISSDLRGTEVPKNRGVAFSFMI